MLNILHEKFQKLLHQNALHQAKWLLKSNRYISMVNNSDMQGQLFLSVKEFAPSMNKFFSLRVYPIFERIQKLGRARC